MLWCCLCRCMVVQCALLPPWVASLRVSPETMHWDSWTQRWLTGDTQQQQAQQASGRSSMGHGEHQLLGLQLLQAHIQVWAQRAVAPAVGRVLLCVGVPR